VRVVRAGAAVLVLSSWATAALAAEATVKAPETSVRTAPHEIAPELARLRAGVTVSADARPFDAAGTWRRVRLADGRYGLVHEADVDVKGGAPLEPPPPPSPPPPPAPEVDAELSDGSPALLSGGDLTPATTSRLFFGLGGALTQDRLAIDGRPAVAQDTGSAEPDWRVEVGYARRLSHGLGASALLMYGTWSDAWSVAAGEGRWRLDLRPSVELSLIELMMGPAPWRRADVVLSAGGGPSVAGLSPSQHRTVRESYGTASGLNAGWRLAMSTRGGFYLAFDVSWFWLWARHEAHVVGDPSFDVDERFAFSGRAVGATFGYAHAW
jgi:hypothetical protein